MCLLVVYIASSSVIPTLAVELPLELPVGPRYIRAKESRFISSVLNVQAHGSRSGCFSAVKLASAASLVQQDAPAPVRRRGLGAAHGRK